MRKLFHNMLQTLKKDEGAHFAYNLGVSFMRFGAFLLCAAAISALLFIFNPTDLLRYKGKTTAAITNIHVQTIAHNGRNGYTEHHIYHVTFDVTIGTTHAVAEQTVPWSVYNSYEKIGRDSPFDAKLYAGDSGLYVSRRGRFLAQLEYGRAHHFVTMGYAAIWLVFAAMTFIGIGLRQERLGMKYPRTDVGHDEFAITPADQADTDELLREFDEAYEKFQANRAAGLPTSEPPRTDGKKSGGETLRLEKK